MQSKDFWVLALVFLGFSIANNFFFPFFLMIFFLPLGILLVVSPAALVLFYFKKKAGYYLSLAYSGFVSTGSLIALIYLFYLQSIGAWIDTTNGSTTTLTFLLAYYLVCHAPLVFLIWKSKGFFDACQKKPVEKKVPERNRDLLWKTSISLLVLLALISFYYSLPQYNIVSLAMTVVYIVLAGLIYKKTKAGLYAALIIIGLSIISGAILLPLLFIGSGQYSHMQGSMIPTIIVFIIEWWPLNVTLFFSLWKSRKLIETD